MPLRFGGPGQDWLQLNLSRLPLMVNLAWGLFRDPRVPRPMKAALLGVLAYVASPLDLIPDFIPVVGRIDDLLILLAAIDLFVRQAPPDVVAEIEAEYQRGHSPLRTDLKAAEEHLGRFWRWAQRKVESFGRKYGRRVEDDAFVRDVKERSMSSTAAPGR